MEKTERDLKQRVIYTGHLPENGIKIHIVESSAAEYDVVWICFEGHTFEGHPGEYYASHLDKEGAKAVVKGLQAWLKEKR